MGRSARPRRLTDGLRELAGSHWPLARMLARPFKAEFPDWRAEFDSAAGIGLVEAAGTFDPASGVRFSSFARSRILGALRDERRRRLARLRTASDDRLAGVLCASADRPECEVDREDGLESWLRRLPRQHAEVCRLIYRDGLRQAEVAGRLGHYPSRISYLHAEAITLLREAARGR